MVELPRLKTDRLLLRPFEHTDGIQVQKLAGDIRVAATTALIPHPYVDGMAEDWIATHEATFNSGRGLVLAMTIPPDESIIGAIGFTIAPEHSMAELGYWVGVPFWGKGYCTEAARALVDFGFTDLAFNRIHAHHFGNNPASGRVLEKVGMKSEGCSRRAFLKWGEYLDIRRYGILRTDWAAGRNPNSGE